MTRRLRPDGAFTSASRATCRWKFILKSEKTITIPSEERLQELVESVIKLREERTLVLIFGEMGVGKTTFVRKLLAQMGGDPDVMSPTFALHNEYKVTDGIVDHLDLYRLENQDELESSGFWDLFSKSSGLIIVEWSERLNIDWLPKNWTQIHLRFSFHPDGKSRTVGIRRG